MNCEVVEVITGITIAIVFLIGALAMYGSFVYGEMKGIERGLDIAEDIAREVHDERIRGNVDRA